ncbi:MAG: sensor histidine kinase, partial [Saprospiraceae bacterium]
SRMSLMDLIQQFSLIWGIIAIANFLNNLRKNWKHLRNQGEKLIETQKASLSSQSELDALQAKINPHFLYNSLNSIASLAQTNPVKTEEMALALSDFYKHSTNRQEEYISTLELEIKQLETYLAIEKIRFGDRLQYQLDIEKDALKTSIPRFLLQPVVENAIKYGFNKTSDKIEIKIQGNLENDQLHLRIIDSGTPFSGQMNTGYGLRSIKKKLKLLYPNAHEIHFLNKPVKQVHIILKTAKNH